MLCARWKGLMPMCSSSWKGGAARFRRRAGRGPAPGATAGTDTPKATAVPGRPRGRHPRPRNAVMAAQNEARAAGHDQIRPEHLVLGLLADPAALAAAAIVAQGVQLDDVRRAVTAVLPPPAGEVPALIPFDQQARKALELTFREALRMGHNYIGTEHLLFALLELEDSGSVLAGLGIDKSAAAAYVTEAVAQVQAKVQAS